MSSKKKRIKRLKIKKSVLLVLFLVIFSALAFLQFTRSEEVEGIVTEYDKALEPGTELIYYLDVTYDGVDREGVEASNSTLSKVYSDYIYVEDKLPNGLTFKEFVSTDLMFAAKPQGDTSQVCDGYVEDDSGNSSDPKNYKGLHYDESTRTVSFKVKRLQAGCHLTVGIVTKLPDTVDDPTTSVVEKRRDFWNSANAWEGSQFVTSNLVHAWIESENAVVHKVEYQYDSSAPPNAPVYPTQEYEPGTNVGLMPEPKIEGYIFKGWKIIKGLSATITGNSFLMPNEDVIVQGSFEPIQKNLVMYEIEGDIPEGYILPESKEYYENATVNIDSMKKGDTFNGYRFSGWSSDDVTIDSDGKFVMPGKDIVLKGSFELITYKVEYQYQGSNVPPEAIIPSSENHLPGDVITLPHVTEIPGYEFLSWDKEDGFIMPDNDVIVYGEWRVKKGLFTPTIKKEIINKKDYYHEGDVVEYRITVTNPTDSLINNIYVKENNEKATFVYDETGSYNVRSSRVVELLNIPPNGSASTKSIYKVTNEDNGTIINEVEIVSGSSDNFELDLTDEAKEQYKATAKFEIASKLKICKKNEGKIIQDQTYQFHVQSTDEEYETWLNLGNNECRMIYVDPKEYQVTEIVPQSYELLDITYSSNLSGVRNGNTSTFTVGKYDSYEVIFTNKYSQKGYLHADGNIVNTVEPVRLEEGEEICFGDECFYNLGYDKETGNYKLFAKYNLYVGNYVSSSGQITSLDIRATDENGKKIYGKQNILAIGDKSSGVRYGTVPFNKNQIAEYLNNYIDLLNNTYDINASNGHLITVPELTSLGCDVNRSKTDKSSNKNWGCEYPGYSRYAWVLNTTYWAGSDTSSTVYLVGGDGFFMPLSRTNAQVSNATSRGVRPVIEVPAKKIVISPSSGILSN